jgi:hypothetical protein
LCLKEKQKFGSHWGPLLSKEYEFLSYELFKVDFGCLFKFFSSKFLLFLAFVNNCVFMMSLEENKIMSQRESLYKQFCEENSKTKKKIKLDYWVTRTEVCDILLPRN